MIHSFFGTDVIQARAAAQDFIATQKENGVSVTRFSGDVWTQGDMEQALGGTSLFGETHLYVLDTPEENKEMEEYVYAHIQDCAESPNTFVLITGKVLAAQKKKLEKYSESISEHTLSKEKPFNIFALGDALLRKDKKSLWILYTEAKQSGHSDEEILGTLFWQVKVLSLVGTTQSAEEAGVSAFPYGKAKRTLYSPEDIGTMRETLVRIYHEGHGGVRDMGNALEAWILSL